MTPVDSPKKNFTPYPFPVYFWPTVLIALAGLGSSIYLATSHYRVYTDMGYRSFCAISQALNCDTVSQSPFSVFLGAPVSIWGVFGYAFVLALLFLAFRREADKKRMWPLLFFTSLIYSLYSIVLALISTIHIHSYCLMCLATYAVNLSLLFLTWIIMRRFGDAGIASGLKLDMAFLLDARARSAALFGAFFVGAILLGLFYPSYWVLKPPRLSADIQRGLTEEGHPWIGAENPTLTIVEYADYQCFQCKKMYYFMRGLIESHPEEIRLVHRHFPMDHKYNPLVKEPFHTGSGTMALLAIHAAGEGRFWKMHDLLFELVGKRDTLDFEEIGGVVGMDPKALGQATVNPDYRKFLWNDILSGLKLELTGTPGYVIDGKIYSGQIPPEILAPVLD